MLLVMRFIRFGLPSPTSKQVLTKSCVSVISPRNCRVRKDWGAANGALRDGGLSKSEDI